MVSNGSEQEIPVVYTPGNKFTEQINVEGCGIYAKWENYESETGGEFHTQSEISKPELTLKPLVKTPWYTASTVLECDLKHLWNEVKNTHAVSTS